MQIQWFRFVVLVCALVVSPLLSALELVPRMWSHLPMGAQFGGAAYAYTEADISVDPLLELESVEMESDTWLAKYIRTFEFFEHAARIDVTQGYQEAEWNGILEGSPATAKRSGATDTFVRLSANLYGAPPLKGKAFSDYRKANTDNTIIGAAVVLRLPTGSYYDDRLLNIGGNRYVLRPQFGISAQHGDWLFETTAEVSLYLDDNDDFFGGQRLEQDPLYIVHTHAIYNFRPGLWVSLSAGYDYGGETSVNGDSSDNRKQNIGWGLSASYPLSRRLGLTLNYVDIRTRESTGADVESLLLSAAYMW